MKIIRSWNCLSAMLLFSAATAQGMKDANDSQCFADGTRQDAREQAAPNVREYLLTRPGTYCLGKKTIEVKSGQAVKVTFSPKEMKSEWAVTPEEKDKLLAQASQQAIEASKK